STSPPRHLHSFPTRRSSDLALIGTKFRIILGYPGGNDINLAMERGEVAGRGSNSWSAWKSTRPEWVREKKLNVLVQIGLKKAPRSEEHTSELQSRSDLVCRL